MTTRSADKDRIPTWDGSPEAFDDFTISLSNFCKEAETWKEPQQIAKVIGKFNKNEKPWRLLAALSESERDKITTRKALLEYLKGHLMESAVPELGRNFRSWVRLRREPRESMRIFVLRHRQVLAKMETSLNQAQTSSELENRLKLLIDKSKLKKLSSERAEKLRKLRKQKQNQLSGTSGAGETLLHLQQRKKMPKWTVSSLEKGMMSGKREIGRELQKATTLKRVGGRKNGGKKRLGSRNSRPKSQSRRLMS